MTTFQPLPTEQSISIAFSVTEVEMEAFRILSGDNNPLHSDADFARQHGFQAPLVYGGLIVAKISQVLGNEIPGSRGVWSGLQIDFRQPLYVGEQAEIEARVDYFSEATRSLKIKLRVVVGDRLIATATALATLVAPAETNGLA